MRSPVSKSSATSLFEEMIELSPEGKCVVNLDGNVIYSNRQFRKMSGLSKTALHKERVYHWFMPSGDHTALEIWNEYVRNAISKSNSVQWQDCTAVTPSGSERNWKLHFVKMPKDSCFLISALDITEQDGIHGTLTENEQQFRALAESIPQLVWIARADGQLFWWNQRWFNYSGMTSRDMKDYGWRKAYDPHALDEIKEWWETSIQAGLPCEKAIRLRGNDQVYRWFLTRVIPVRNRYGKIVRWFGTNTDIDDIKRGASFSLILQEFASAISASGQIELVTRAMLTFGKKALLSDTSFVFLHNKTELFFDVIDDLGFEPSIKGKKYTAKPEQFESLAACHSGCIRVLDIREKVEVQFPEAYQFMLEHKFQMLILAPFLIENQSVGIMGFGYTACRNLREDEKEFLRSMVNHSIQSISRAQLIKNLEKEVQTRDRFLSIASHELSTPITALKLQVQMMYRQIQSKVSIPYDKLSSSLATSALQLKRLSRLVDNLLDVSRIHSGKLDFQLETINYSEMILDLANQYAERFEDAQCTLQLDIQPNMIGMADVNRLEQVFVNLISNTLKYAPGKPLTISGKEKDDCIEISFRDFGPGIPADKRQTIFYRFERAVTNRNVTGLGLGLFIADELVKAHGGTIRLESEVGVGSNFIVSLPKYPHQHQRKDLNWQALNENSVRGQT